MLPEDVIDAVTGTLSLLRPDSITYVVVAEGPGPAAAIVATATTPRAVAIDPDEIV